MECISVGLNSSLYFNLKLIKIIFSIRFYSKKIVWLWNVIFSLDSTLLLRDVNCIKQIVVQPTIHSLYCTRYSVHRTQICV